VARSEPRFLTSPPSPRCLSSTRPKGEAATSMPDINRYTCYKSSFACPWLVRTSTHETHTDSSPRQKVKCTRAPFDNQTQSAMPVAKICLPRSFITRRSTDPGKSGLRVHRIAPCHVSYGDFSRNLLGGSWLNCAAVSVGDLPAGYHLFLKCGDFLLSSRSYSFP